MKQNGDCGSTAIDQLVDRALALHARNFNCAQSVACTLAPLIEASEDSAFRLMEGFGSGMGGKSETCGALSGAIAMLGAANSCGPSNPVSKQGTYALASECVERFRMLHGTAVCRDIRGTDEPGTLPVCEECIADCVRIGADIVFDRQRRLAENR